MLTRLNRGLLAAAIACGLLLAQPVFASHATADATSATNLSAGATSTYTLAFTPCCGTYGPVVAPGNGRVVLTFPTGYDLTNASFDAAASGIRQVNSGPYSAFPAHTVAINTVARTVTISNIDAPIDQDNTGFRLVVAGVRNPSTSGVYNVNEQTFDGSTQFSNFSFGGFNVTVPPGVDLDVPGDAARYASEIIASSGAPVTLTNNAGVLNLNVPLGYNPSHDEVRYARIECAGIQFANNTTVTYNGGGTASVGAVNGFNSSAIYFSFTADSNVSAADRLVVSGDRLLTGNQPVSCTYGLYDQPSQAVAGGTSGRIATLTGAYITFAPSTVFTSVTNTSTASVDANPAYSAFVPNGATTASTAALARLTYALATPAPLKPSGTSITLADLHATGASGTKIVVSGDFSAGAGVLASTYLSTNSSSCVFGTAASTLSATTATFNVGATATDRLLCYAPASGVAVPAATYTALLDGVSAMPTLYRVDDIGPVAAGAIVRNGTQLQAPLVQLPTGYISRVALTNTGTVSRRYAISVISEAGNAVAVDSTKLSGEIPGSGVRVVDLREVLTSFSTATRASIVVTVDAPNNTIQGIYQIVRPDTGAISNHPMVRPGTN